MNEQEHTDLNRFVDRLREGDATAREITEWERRLADDAELRRCYRARMRMEANLQTTFQADRPDLTPPLMGELPARTLGWWGLATAAGIAAALALGLFLGSGDTGLSDGPVVAHLESESEASWSGGMPILAGVPLRAGTFELKTGLAELRFESGVLLALEAPARLDLIDPMRCRLHQGTAVLDVPDSGKGFIVETPGGHAVDHGTRFAINVPAEKRSADFEVLSGRISVHHTRSGAMADLTNAQAVRMTQAGIEKLESLPSFMLERPTGKSLRLHTNGRESSIIRIDTEKARIKSLDPDLLMVKRDLTKSQWSADSPAFYGRDRRSLIAFRLGEIEPEAVDSATLQLNLVPTGLGFASRLPETCTFEVYGIRDDAGLEAWPEEGLHWKEAPGSVDGNIGDPSLGGAIDSSEVHLLGRVEIPRGKVTGRVVFESSELTEFVRQDTTGEVGFLLVRATPPLDGWSLVHAFAASTHPDAAGPTLELKFKGPAESGTADFAKNVDRERWVLRDLTGKRVSPTLMTAE